MVSPAANVLLLSVGESEVLRSAITRDQIVCILIQLMQNPSSSEYQHCIGSTLSQTTLSLCLSVPHIACTALDRAAILVLREGCVRVTLYRCESPSPRASKSRHDAHGVVKMHFFLHDFLQLCRRQLGGSRDTRPDHRGSSHNVTSTGTNIAMHRPA